MVFQSFVGVLHLYGNLICVPCKCIRCVSGKAWIHTSPRSPPLSLHPSFIRGRLQNISFKPEGGGGRPVDRGVWTVKTVKRPRQQPAHPQCANYRAPLTRKRHILPHSAQPQHTNYWAPRTRKRHQQEHRPQRPTESSDPTQHAKGRMGDCPGPRKGATTRRNVTQGGGGGRPRGAGKHPPNLPIVV